MSPSLSDDEVEGNSGQVASSSQHKPSSKKRRIQLACDVCRSRKVRCDGPVEKGKCHNCTSNGSDCTYTRNRVRKTRTDRRGYVDDLECKLEKVKTLLSQPRPNTDFSCELDFEVHYSWYSDAHATPTSDTALPGIAVPLCGIEKGSTPDPDSSSSNSNDDKDEIMLLSRRMDKVLLDDRFFGKSSGAPLLEHVKRLKYECTGMFHEEQDLPFRRSRFWDMSPWEFFVPPPEQPEFVFPDADLTALLVDLYFTRSNAYFPLLHRPTFERGIVEGLHLRDRGFGGTLLGVCALGARYTSDTRVLLGPDSSLDSAGWKWFNQVQTQRRSLQIPPTLYDLQALCLCVLFLQGSTLPHIGWTLLGVAVRMAQDVGAHRRKGYAGSTNAEDELRKRVFWVLICLDRYVSSSLGRPCAVQDEDFDLDLPAECDDKYWENAHDPSQNFKQPPGKPAAIAYFICLLKLNQILSFALRTIYSINKSKTLLGFVGKEWEQTVVAELDSAMNKWIDGLPDHLRWDPTRKDTLFFTQSAALNASYYQLQISIHRPFISLEKKASPLSFSSLAICTNAARSCSHILDTLRRRSPNYLHAPYSLPAVFSSAVVLLLNIWGAKRSGVSIDMNDQLADVHKCMDALKCMEERWRGAGCLWDKLYDLAAVGDLLKPPYSIPANHRKRDRHPDGDESTSPQKYPASGLYTGFDSVASPSSSGGPKPTTGPERRDSAPLDVSCADSFTSPSLSDEPGQERISGQRVHDPMHLSQWLFSDAPKHDALGKAQEVHSMDQSLSGQTLDPSAAPVLVDSFPGPGSHDDDAHGMALDAHLNLELDDWGTYLMDMLGNEQGL